MAHILVVDDEPDSVDMIVDWLHAHGYDVLTAANGLEALEVAKRELPDLVLLDVKMPEMNGIDVCKQLRSHDQTAHIPVVLLTGYDPADGRVEALMAGATDYLLKPIDFKALKQRLGVLLAHDDAMHHHNQRLLDETVHSALAIVPCSLAWLTTIDRRGQKLINRALATSQDEDAAIQAMIQEGDSDDLAIPLDKSASLLVEVALSSVAEFNLPLSRLREDLPPTINAICDRLNLYYAIIMPLQVVGIPLGALLLGSREPRDVETVRGRQLLAAVASQAATAVRNAQLLNQLAEREAESNQERAFRQTLLDTMGDGLLVYDSAGTITFANRRLATMTGHEVGTLPGRSVESLFIAEARDNLSQVLRGTIGENASSLETMLLSAHGKHIPVLAARVAQEEITHSTTNDRVLIVTDLSTQRTREEGLAQQAHRLRALTRATQAITSTLSVDDAIQVILGEAEAVLSPTLVCVLLKVEDAGQLIFHSARGPQGEALRGHSMPLNEGVAGFVARAGEPLLLTEIDPADIYYQQVEQITGVQARDVIAAPIVVEDEIVGVVEAINKGQGTFDEADLNMIEGLAHSTAIALGNAWLYGEARRHVRELTLLLKASDATSSTLSIEQVVESVSRQLMEALRVKWCIVSAWDEGTEHLTYLSEVVDIKWPPGRGKLISLAEKDAIAILIESKKPRIIELSSAEQVATMLDETIPDVASSRLIVPIELAGDIVGIADLYHTGNLNFTIEDFDRCHTAIETWGRKPQVWHDEGNVRQLGIRLMNATGAARCSIYNYVAETRTLQSRTQSGKIVWPLNEGPATVPAEASLRAIALNERQPIAARLSELEQVELQRIIFPEVSTGAVLVIPLMAHGEAVGLVELIDVDPAREFTDNDLSLAQAIGNVVGNALENTRLYGALLQRASQLEAAYLDLQEADRLKAEWVQNVSHELRTPLTTLIGYIDLMIEKDLGPITDEQYDGLSIMATKSRELRMLVDDILSIQELDRATLTQSATSIIEIARQSIEAKRAEALEGHLQIDFQTPDSLEPIPLDGVRIRQVFDNLLDNAIKFSPDSGTITVLIEDIETAVQVTVRDQGIGIPQDEHDKIWRRFYQVDGSMTRTFGGTGLGLAIVQEIIKGHNGRVWVESTPGKGSTFCFILPKAYAFGAEILATAVTGHRRD